MKNIIQHKSDNIKMRERFRGEEKYGEVNENVIMISIWSDSVAIVGPYPFYLSFQLNNGIVISLCGQLIIDKWRRVVAMNEDSCGVGTLSLV